MTGCAVNPEPYRRRSLVPGVAISLSLHAGLLAWVVHQRPPLPAAAPSRWLTVSLVPARQTPQPAPETESKPRQHDVPPPHARQPSPGQPAHAAAPQPVTAGQPQRGIAAAPPPAVTTAAPPAPPAANGDAPDPFAAPPAPRPGAFDASAALKSARKLAVAKAGKDDPAVAQLQDKPVNGLAADSTLGKDMKRAARPDCLTAGAGAGILAPLLLAAMVLTDKKDHGCKW